MRQCNDCRFFGHCHVNIIYSDDNFETNLIIFSQDLSYKDKHWHEACFLCNKCRVSLVDKQFGSKVDKIYCGNCYDAQFASRCDGCGEIFRAGMLLIILNLLVTLSLLFEYEGYNIPSLKL